MADEEVNVEMDSGEPVSKRARIVGTICAIAQPLAGKKLHKRVFKLVGKAAASKSLKRGVKEVVKALRKGEKGLCIIAGDISPIDVISHIPGLCEDCSVPYIYVESKSDLGASAATKRPTSVVLISASKKGGEKEKELFASERYKEVFDEVKALGPTE